MGRVWGITAPTGRGPGPPPLNQRLGRRERMAGATAVTDAGTAPDPEKAVTTPAPEDVSGLKAKNAELIAKNKSLAALAKQYDGIDPEQARAAMEGAKLAEEQRAKAAGEWDKHKAKLQDEFTKERTALEGKTERYRAALYEREVRLAARQALEVVAVSVDLLMPHVEKHLRMVEAPDGTVGHAVIGPDGEPRLKGSKGEPMTVVDLVEEMRSQSMFLSAFKGTGSTGTGAMGGAHGAGAGPVRSRSDLQNDKDKASFIGKFGLQAFKDLPAA